MVDIDSHQLLGAAEERETLCRAFGQRIYSNPCARGFSERVLVEAEALWPVTVRYGVSRYRTARLLSYITVLSFVCAISSPGSSQVQRRFLPELTACSLLCPFGGDCQLSKLRHSSLTHFKQHRRGLGKLTATFEAYPSRWAPRTEKPAIECVWVFCYAALIDPNGHAVSFHV